MKRFLSICLLSLFMLLNFALSAQTEPSYCIWIENDQPSTPNMQYVLEAPEGGATHTYSLYIDGVNVPQDGKYAFRIAVESFQRGEWTIIDNDHFFNLFLQTNIPFHNNENNWIDRGTNDITDNGSLTYPHPEYFNFDGDNNHDYFNWHFFEYSTDKLINGSSALRFGITWNDIPAIEDVEYRVKFMLEERECGVVPEGCLDYNGGANYYFRNEDGGRSIGGHQSLPGDIVATTYFNELEIIEVADAICYGDPFTYGSDENLNPYDLTQEIIDTYADVLSQDNLSVIHRDTLANYENYCGTNIFTSVHDLSLTVYHQTSQPEGMETIRFGNQAIVDLAELYPSDEEMTYLFYETLDAEEQLPSSIVTITADANYYVAAIPTEILGSSCESDRATITIYLVPNPVIALDSIADVCPSAPAQTTDLNVTVLREEPVIPTVVYTWNGVTSELTTGTVEVTDNCDSTYVIEATATYTYTLNDVDYVAPIAVATTSFRAYDDQAPTYNEDMDSLSFQVVSTMTGNCEYAFDASNLDAIFAALELGDNCTEFTAENIASFLSFSYEGTAFNFGDVLAIDTYPAAINIHVLDKCGNELVVEGKLTLTIVDPIAIVSIEETTASGTDCVNQDFVLTSEVAGGTAPYTYLWDDVDTTTTEGLTVNITAPGLHTYTLVATDANGCTSTKVFEFEVDTLPVVTISGDNTICLGGNTELTAVGAETYEWSPMESLTVNAENTAVVVAAPTADETYTVVGTDGNGCVALATTYDVTVLPLPVLTAADTVVCENEIVNLATLIEGADTYVWSFNDEELVATAIVFDAAGTYTYNVFGTDTNGCSNTATVTVTVNPLPVLELTQPEAICLGDSLDLATTVTGADTYEWYDADGVLLTSTVVTPATAGKHKYKVVGTNSVTGCVSTGVYKIKLVVNALPQIAIGTLDVQCYGENTGRIEFSDYIGTTADYDFEVYGPQHNPRFDASSDNLPAGVYEITIIDPATGCQIVRFDTINEPEELNPGTISAPAGKICHKTNATIENVTLATGGTEPYVYSWEKLNDNGVWQTANNETATHESFTTGNLGKSKQYRRVVTDACESKVTAPVTVEVNTKIVIGEATITDAICNGAANGTIALDITGGTAPYTLVWNNDETINSTALPAGDYTVVVTDAINCTATGTVTYTVEEPEAMLAGSIASTDEVICNNYVPNMITGVAPTNTVGNVTYQWQISTDGVAFENILDATDINYQPEALLVNTYYKRIDTDQCSTLETNVVLITVTSPIQITGVVTNINCNGDASGAINITVTGGTAPYAYAWTPAASTEDLTDLTVGTYNVVVTDAIACTANAEFTLIQNPALVAGTIAIENENDEICYNEVPAQIIGTPATNVVGEVAYQWYASTDGATYVAIDGATEVSYQPAALTTTTNYYRKDSDECFTEETNVVIVTVNALPTVTAATNKSAICLGQQTATLTAGGASTYAWAPIGATDIMVTVEPTATTTYTVTGTDINGCVNTATVTVIVNELPEVVASDDAIICSATSTTLTVAGAATYVWTLADAEVATGEEYTVTLTNTNPEVATTTYNVTGTDANGCYASDEVTVSVAAVVPEMNVEATAATVCYNAEAVVATINNYATVLDYATITPSVTAGTVSINTQGEVLYTPTEDVAGQNVTITLTAVNDINSDCNGDVADFTFAVRAIPTVEFVDFPTTACLGESLTVSFTSTEALGTIALMQANDQVGTEASFNGAGNYEFTFPTTDATAGELYFQLQYTDAGGCVEEIITTESILYNSNFRLIVKTEDEYLGGKHVDNDQLAAETGVPTAFYVAIANECSTPSSHVYFTLELFDGDQAIALYPNLSGYDNKEIRLGLEKCHQEQGLDQQIEIFNSANANVTDMTFPLVQEWSFDGDDADVQYFNTNYLLGLDPANEAEGRVFKVELPNGFEFAGNYRFECKAYDVKNVQVANQYCGETNPVGAIYTPATEKTWMATRDMFINVELNADPAQPVVTVPTTDALVPSISMYPNPTNGEVNIAVQNMTGAATFAIADIAGSIVSLENVVLDGKAIRKDVSSLKPGMYIVTFQNVNGEVVRGKVIVQQ